MKYRSFPFLFLVILFFSCSPSRQIAKSARENILSDESLQTAHVGISIYEPATGKYWYNYQGDKYFVPASNTKLPTCYAAMKYLGDSLVGLKYGFSGDKDPADIVLAIQPTGDPTFLHQDFKRQPVFDFLKHQAKDYRYTTAVLDTIWRDKPWGSGWSWNDYDASYMPERNSLPIFGNILQIKIKDVANRNIDSSLGRPVVNFLRTQSHLFDSIINADLAIEQKVVYFNNERGLSPEFHIQVRRELDDNKFHIEPSSTKFTSTEMPFVTYGNGTALGVLSDSLKFSFGFLLPGTDKFVYDYICPDCMIRHKTIDKWIPIHSQPTDSLLKPMMHNSDNFFAEQSLLMVSNELIGVMNDEKIIDSLLKTDFKDLPQKPHWVDGSGLSRYNLFTPQDFVFILNKMRTDFGMDRIKTILPTGDEGTLEGRFANDRNFIFAKTGTLSGVVALSGFLYTKKNKLLIFSVLVNNHSASARQVRSATEKFIHGIRERY